jgi:hypothetical protein
MTRYIIPALMIAMLIGVLVAIHQGFMSLSNVFSSDFPMGFIAGCAFCAGLYYLIQWLEPSGTDGHRRSTDQE